MLQSLQRIADVEIFFTEELGYGLSACTKMDPEKARTKLSEALSDWYEQRSRHHSVDMVIGQFHRQALFVQVLKRMLDDGVRVINISMDDRLSFNPRRKEGACYFFEGVSGTTTTCPECVPWYLQEGQKVLYWPEASDPTIFYPRQVRDLDVVFVGSRYGIREKMIQKISKAGINVHAYGPGWTNGPVDTPGMSELFGRAKIVLGFGYVGHSRNLRILKLRDFDAPMSGACYVTTYTPDLVNFYDIGKEIVCYRDANDCVNLVRTLLQRPEDRECIGALGRLKAASIHTWESRWQILLNWARGL
jgi:hypothetical protein